MSKCTCPNPSLHLELARMSGNPIDPRLCYNYEPEDIKTVRASLEAVRRALIRSQAFSDTISVDLAMSVTECKHGNNVVDEICGYCWSQLWTAAEVARDALQAVKNTDDHANADVRWAVRDALAALSVALGET